MPVSNKQSKQPNNMFLYNNDAYFYIRGKENPKRK